MKDELTIERVARALEEICATGLREDAVVVLVSHKSGLRPTIVRKVLRVAGRLLEETFEQQEPRASRRRAPQDPNTLTGPQRRVLEALGKFETVGLREPDRTMVAFLAGVSPRSSAYSNNLGSLRSRGFIDYRNGAVVLTDKGRKHAAPGERPVNNREMLVACADLLTPKQAEILRVVWGAYPEALSVSEVARITGASIKSSAFSNNLGALRSRKLIAYKGAAQDRMIRCQDWMFVEGKDG